MVAKMADQSADLSAVVTAAAMAATTADESDETMVGLTAGEMAA